MNQYEVLPLSDESWRAMMRRDAWFQTMRTLVRVGVTLAVLGGCTYLVFWRGESGWLYLPALILARFAR
jgi:hypothetical protein